MGVTGLWKELKPAAVTTVFEKLAAEVFDDAFEAWENDEAGASASASASAKDDDARRSGVLGLKVGVDASAWFFHSELAEGGANPELRTLYSRCIRLARAGTYALFVFDGPHRPHIKRGHRIYRGAHGLQRDFIRIIEAFGYEWRVAPGEAEAELAMLNRRGDIDIVITDDVDCLLYGATTIMKHALRSPSTAMVPQVYDRGTIEMETDLTVPGLILVALMSGGDYDQSGLIGVGPKIAIGLAKGGFGEQLSKAVKTLSDTALGTFLHNWREEIRHQLRTNERGLLDRKAAAVSKKITNEWPDVTTIKRYYDPVTSELAQYSSFDKEHRWHGRFELSALTAVLSDLFEYTHSEILQKMRNQIWEAVIVRCLVQSLSGNASSPDTDLYESDPLGTPSKQLAAKLQQTSLASPRKVKDKTRQGTRVPKHMLSVYSSIETRRNHKRMNAANVHTNELRLVIDPSRLVEDACAGLRHPDPNVGKLEQRKQQEYEARQAAQPGAPITPPKEWKLKCDDPYSLQKFWVQESLLRMAFPGLVDKWEARERDKAVSKGKGKTSAVSLTGTGRSRRGTVQVVRAPKVASKTGRKVTPISPSSDEDHDEAPSDSDSDREGDIFAVPVPQTSSSSKEVAPHQPSIDQTSSKNLRRPAVQALTESDSDPEFDSSIEIISFTSTQRQVQRSPKKSPRRSSNTTTARSSEASRPKVTTGRKDSSRPVATAPKVSLYTEISDSDGDSDSASSLPDLAAYAKESSLRQLPSEQTVATGSKKTSNPTMPSFVVQQKKNLKASIAKRPIPKATSATVIDLCSSD